jgi:hypothetical protein
VGVGLAGLPGFTRSAQAAPAGSPATDFARGKLAFQRADYARAIDILRPLLYPEPRLQTEGEVVQAHRMLGVAHLFQHQNDLAAEEFRKLLQLRPDFRMDALIDPPMVVDFFNSILAQQEAELAELEAQRREADALEERRRKSGVPCVGPTVVERRTIRNSRAVSFLPFGAGQFQNGHARKGWGFLAAEAFFGAVSVGALTTNFALYGVRPTLKCERAGNPNARHEGCSPGYQPGPEQARSQLLLRVQVISGALFFATAIWGVTDAILNFQPEVEVTTPIDQIRPPPTLPPPRKSSVSSLRVIPSLFPGTGMGGSLAFRF